MAAKGCLGLGKKIVVDPTIGPDGTVYAWNENKGLEALNPQNGDRYWSSADVYVSHGTGPFT